MAKPVVKVRYVVCRCLPPSDCWYVADLHGGHVVGRRYTNDRREADAECDRLNRQVSQTHYPYVEPWPEMEEEAQQDG